VIAEISEFDARGFEPVGIALIDYERSAASASTGSWT
jgi:hypothetical protein